MIEVQPMGKISQSMLDAGTLAIVMDFSAGVVGDNGSAAEVSSGSPPYVGFFVDPGRPMGSWG